ncbi:GlxA family transcriptional regulator [uncultured Maritalea sp.]|jgi:transcriptional regulator GlxA family with amidase domain|uniref:GlxA family transcriptional regulator n=1 Tax=uncultured Maritalea sp. TaxID=757249 RepID=UPI002603F752|nr:helix-turn-helix domain-containing protein [uncultured Maritalea sp.]
MAQHIKVHILLAPNPLMLDFAGPAEVLRRANKIQSEIIFDVQYIAPRDEMLTSAGLKVSGLSKLPNQLQPNSFLMVSGTTKDILGDLPSPSAAQRAADNKTIIEWLGTAFTKEQTLLTICSGALLAARAGLFDGYRCTTHHDCLEELRSISPQIKIEENRLFTEDRNRFASAGITSGTDLMLHIVGKKLGIAAAAEIAKHMVVYARRNGDAPQLSPWLQGRSHLHPTIHRIQDLIAADPTKDWDVSSLAKQAHMSARHFSRLFNNQTGLSVPDYVNGLRIAIAENALRAEQINIEHLVGDLGFGSSRHFRRAWQKHHQLSPTQWRQSQQV